MTETLSTENGRTVLRMRRELRHPVEKVWRAITEPGQLAGWFPAAVEFDLRLDGPVTFTFETDPGAPVDVQTSGVIRAYEPPKLLEYTWGVEVLRWELDPVARRVHAAAHRDVRRPSGIRELHRRLDAVLRRAGSGAGRIGARARLRRTA